MFDFEFIDPDDVQRASRGRKPHPETVALSEAFASVPNGSTVRIADMAASDDRDKAAKGSRIRAAAALVGKRASIAWAPTTNVPQVTLTEA